jgi:hypothetical protein
MTKKSFNTIMGELALLGVNFQVSREGDRDPKLILHEENVSLNGAAIKYISDLVEHDDGVFIGIHQGQLVIKEL